MKKSISIIGVIVLLFFALFILTGCGNNGSYDKNGKYAKYIEAIRDGQLGRGYGDRTLGELLDNS